jgi:ubiquinone/menaquinone biosynthesis C-methylase UbiE
LTSLLLVAGYLLAFLLLATALFFFMATRGALLARTVGAGPDTAKTHIYPIYTDMRLIRLIDHQPIISAILLFQYHRLVRTITSQIRSMDLRGKKLLITSCAFGNVIPEVVAAALDAGAARVLVADIVQNELLRARDKLGGLAEHVDFIEEDATRLELGDDVVDVNVMFFLLHELPHPQKLRALEEAGRMLRPGGTLFVAEFHRPDNGLLRMLSWLYFKVFEPYGLALWDTHDPIDCMNRLDSWDSDRSTCCFGNYQVIRAIRLGDLPARRQGGVDSGRDHVPAAKTAP